MARICATGRLVSCSASFRSRRPGWSIRSWSWPRPSCSRRPGRPGWRGDVRWCWGAWAGRPDGGRCLWGRGVGAGQAGPGQGQAGDPAGPYPDDRDGEGGRGMGQDPDAIRQDIAQTRSEMSETVEAVGYRADVPSRAEEAVSDKVENVRSKVSDTATRAREAVAGTTSRAGDATPSRGEVKQQSRRVAGMARENPLGLAIGAAAIGFLAGLAVPSTRVEDERLGPVADQVK